MITEILKAIIILPILIFIIYFIVYKIDKGIEKLEGESKMPKFCSKECEEIGAVCDFCKYYDYNGKDLVGEDGKIYKQAIYVGKGYCRLHKEHRDPYEGCNDFVCFKIKEKNNES